MDQATARKSLVLDNAVGGDTAAVANPFPRPNSAGMVWVVAKNTRREAVQHERTKLEVVS